jgi:hypothetical protein
VPIDDEPAIVAVPVVAPDGYGLVHVPLDVNVTGVEVENVSVVALDVVTVGVAVVSEPEPTVAVGKRGAVTAADFSEYGPLPIAFTARTWKTYDVPPISPVTDADVLVDVPSENVDHVPPLSDEN